MRGKHRRIHGLEVGIRIIPAHAGQTSGRVRVPCRLADHPRACGANPACVTRNLPIRGSSPRMRGKLAGGQRLLECRRIIPAHAGQTSGNTEQDMRNADHPRACGANSCAFLSSSALVGSSPRMRGKRLLQPREISRVRIIPAHAGQTSDFMRKLLSAGPSIIGFAQWLQSSYYCSCLQSSAKTPISRGTTPTSLFLGFQNSITLLLLT